jgi:hypothetical protein
MYIGGSGLVSHAQATFYSFSYLGLILRSSCAIKCVQNVARVMIQDGIMNVACQKKTMDFAGWVV